MLDKPTPAPPLDPPTFEVGTIKRYRLDRLPYYEPILLIFDDGNMTMALWYDCSRDDFVASYDGNIPLIGWSPLPRTVLG